MQNEITNTKIIKKEMDEIIHWKKKEMLIHNEIKIKKIISKKE